MRQLNRQLRNTFDELAAFEDNFDSFLDEAIDTALPRSPVIRNMPANRQELLLHGTTLRRAQQIQASGRLITQTTYFALGFNNRAVARVFAHRAASRYPREGGPALVILSVPEETIQRLRQQRLLIARQLADPPEVRGRLEWVLSSGGVDTINRNYEGLRVVRLANRLQPNIASFDAFDTGMDEFDWSGVKRWACKGKCAVANKFCESRCQKIFPLEPNCMSECYRDVDRCVKECG